MTIVHQSSVYQSKPDANFVLHSESTDAERATQTECEPFFVPLETLSESQRRELQQMGLLQSNQSIGLLTDQHVKYLEQVWTTDQLKLSFTSLDASRNWMIYWTVHACDLLHHTPNPDDAERIVRSIQTSWSQHVINTSIPAAAATTTTTTTAGGFGGGPGQMPHAAVTYAAVMTLAILSQSSRTAGTILHNIRPPLYQWMVHELKLPNGAFRMQTDGENDVRATYCVMAVASLLNILTPTLQQNATEYIAQCQTYEGGFGGEPFNEAHGGYTYCACAALQILHGWNAVDVQALTHWLTARQMSYEGGFNGRTNKLVDGCYSFWQGAAVAIVSYYYATTRRQYSYDLEDPWSRDNNSKGRPALLLDDGMLERYILLCAQDINGGLRDKPSKRRDFYHSCYNLSGLSIAQHCSESDSPSYGHETQSMVAATHPCYNIRREHVQRMKEIFYPESSNTYD